MNLSVLSALVVYSFITLVVRMPQAKTIETTPPKPLGATRYWALAAICVVTFFCFQNSIHNQFTNWDDDVYVTNDTIIQHLTGPNIKRILTEDITKNNFHPLCMLSLAANYHFSKLAPATYYLTNILIHIANVILVFFLITQLCALLKLKELDGFIIAAFSALWFGIHPLHVESVSWIAERKDVMYTFFYLLALLAYIKQFTIHNSPFTIKNKWYWITFSLFILSCLSKPMAVVLPLSLLCIDYLLGRKIEFKLLLEKAPFFIVALLFGGYAYYTQNRTGAIADFNKLTLAERTMYAAYGFDMYLYKLINPSFLSTFYPYPYRYIDGSLPFIYYAAPFIAMAIIALPLYITYRFFKKHFAIAAFGMAFFVANIIFVLQFISCGAAIMADRYSYVSSIGILFAIAYFVNELIKKYPSAKVAILAVLLTLSSILAYGCYQRTKVWHNSETLYKDAITKYPYRALLSYKWLGFYYMNQGDTNNAVQTLNVLAQLNAGDAKIYDLLGNVDVARGDFKSALDLYNRSLKQQNNVSLTYIDRSIVEASLGDSTDAIKDYAIALQIDRGAEKRYAQHSFDLVQAKKYKEIVGQYNTLLTITPANPYYRFYRAVAKFGLNDMPGAITDFELAYKSGVKEVAPVAAFNLAVACDSVGDERQALFYADAAAKLGMPPQADFIQKLKFKEQLIERKREHSTGFAF